MPFQANGVGLVVLIAPSVCLVLRLGGLLILVSSWGVPSWYPLLELLEVIAAGDCFPEQVTPAAGAK
jgi:hypothetical protein